MAGKPGYEVVFRGKLVRGADPQVVRDNLCRLFKAPAEKIEALFQGGRHVLKRGLSHEQAHHYREVLKKAGAIVVVVDAEAKADMQALRPGQAAKPAARPAPVAAPPAPPEKPATSETPNSHETGSPASDLLAPVGAPVNDPVEPPPPPEFDLTPYALDEPGVVIVEPQEKPQPTIDISHIRIDDSDRPHEQKPPAEPPAVDPDRLSFTDEQTPLEPPRDDPEPDIDLSHLRLDS